MPTSRRLLLSAAAAAPLLPGLARAQGGGIAVRIDRDAEVLDPAFRSGLQDGNIVRAIHQRLVTIQPGTGQIVPDAAAELRQASPEVVEFRLKPGQAFTDGYGEMTADDVKFSFERFAVAPAGGKESPYKGDWAGLKAVEVADRYSGRIVLERPRAGLFAIALADVSGCIVSRRAVEERGASYGTRPVGSGPMLLAALEKQRGAVLRRNPAYAGPQSGFAEVAARFVQDPKTAELALRSGELGFALLPPTVAEPLERVASLRVTHQPGIANVWLGMNVEKPPFTDVRVRRAVRMALDVDQMLLAGYNGRAPRANGLVMPGVTGYWPDAPAPRRDVAGARRLLAEAGLPGGFRTRITVLNQPVYQTMALVAQALLREAGITLEVEAQDAGSFFASGEGERGRNLDLFILRFNGKLDPNFLAQWFTTDQIGLWNWQRWANRDFDALLDQASAELDEGKRAALMIRAQQLMEDSAAFMWLTYDVTYAAFRANLRPALLPTGIDWALDQFAPA